MRHTYTFRFMGSLTYEGIGLYLLNFGTIYSMTVSNFLVKADDILANKGSRSWFLELGKLMAQHLLIWLQVTYFFIFLKRLLVLLFTSREARLACHLSNLLRVDSETEKESLQVFSLRGSVGAVQAKKFTKFASFWSLCYARI